MTSFSPLIDELIAALRYLPGVGPKSAQRMAFYLLQRDRVRACHLGNTILTACESIQHCAKCRTLSEETLCQLCQHPRRERHQLCVVGSPVDVLAIEQLGVYQGVYFVLHGHLSPLDGIGPDDIGMGQLQTRLAEKEITELILATNPTVEGEATAHYITELAKPQGIKTTRLAHGMPLGGELEYVDTPTLAHAFAGRVEIV